MQELLRDFSKSKLAQKVRELHLPRYHELPTLELYMDQVISVINGALRPLFSSGDAPVLTPTMVGNYVKQKLVSPPIKKRYNRDHVVAFLVVALLKQVFSIAEVDLLIKRQIQSYPPQTAYDYFCTELETALQMAFGTRQTAVADMADAGTADQELLRSAVLSLVNKIYVQKFLEYAALPQRPESKQG